MAEALAVEPSYLRNINCDGLKNMALSARFDRVAEFDLTRADSTEATLKKWLKDNKPSGMMRSNNLGWILIKSKHCTAEDTKILKGLDRDPIVEDVQEDWKALTTDPGRNVTYNDIIVLANDSGLADGKWMIFSQIKHVDANWKRMALALIRDKFPASVIGIKVSPNLQDYDVKVQGVDWSQIKHSQVIMVYNRYAFNEAEVLQVEQAIRRILGRIKFTITYKPSILGHINIYRKNKFGIKCSYYISRYDRTTDSFQMDRPNENWVYTVPPPPIPTPPGSPDLGFEDDDDDGEEPQHEVNEVDETLALAFQHGMSFEESLRKLPKTDNI